MFELLTVSSSLSAVVVVVRVNGTKEERQEEGRGGGRGGVRWLGGSDVIA